MEGGGASYEVKGGKDDGGAGYIVAGEQPSPVEELKCGHLNLFIAQFEHVWASHWTRFNVGDVMRCPKYCSGESRGEGRG
jgi:hypothetical protein